MLKLLLPLCLAGLAALPFPAPSAPASAPRHCQVPCGIYGDRLRIDLLMEDAATIEKGMKEITALEAGGPGNQLVRWIMTKDTHSQSIQDQIGAYWLAQRIKVPAADASPEAVARYHDQLAHLHRLSVSAMKCKQTTDSAHVAALKEGILSFSSIYFSEADAAHIREHHAGPHEK